jgi:hypothetical protein
MFKWLGSYLASFSLRILRIKLERLLFSNHRPSLGPGLVETRRELTVRSEGSLLRDSL